MPEHGLPLIRLFPYKDRIYDPVLIREYTGQTKLVFWHNFCSEIRKRFYKNLKIFWLSNPVSTQKSVVYYAHTLRPHPSKFFPKKKFLHFFKKNLL